jgi:DNA-binding IclR family transcriptional regulator
MSRQPPADAVSAPVRLIIADHIVSVEQLEILLLLQHHRHRWWTIDEVNQRVQSSPSSVKQRLADLARRGLVEHQDAMFRYGPPLDIEVALAQLAHLYAERQHTIINLIFAGAHR